jgi:chemotaxis protein MotB
MAYKKSSKNSVTVEEDWMVTYADAITLLLCFFVLLLSIMEPKKEKFETMRSAFAEAVDGKAEQPFTDLTSDIQSMIQEKMMEDSMSVEQTERGMIIELSSGAFYATGSAEFKDDAIPMLMDLVDMIKDFNYDEYRIDVEGHTDDVPMSGKDRAFPTNWELSSGRASRVVRFFIEEGLEEQRMKVLSYADTKPKVPNLDEEGNPIPENRELNRRIAIVIERE